MSKEEAACIVAVTLLICGFGSLCFCVWLDYKAKIHSIGSTKPLDD